MATYTKETALYDTNAIADDISAAGETASKFLSADSSGIMIYDGTNGAQTPSNPAATTRNVFIDDNSVDVRLGSDILAAFGEETVIGEDGKSRLVFESSEMYGITDKDVESFRISGDGTTMTNRKSMTHTATAKTSYKYFTLPEVSSGTVFKVAYTTYVSSGKETIKTINVTSGSSISENYVTFNGSKYYWKYDAGTRRFSYKKDPLSSSSSNNKVHFFVTYSVETPSPYYTFGTRKSDSTLGAYSFSVGSNNTVSGLYSFSSGNYTTASGNYSHAEGSYTTASGEMSHAEGSYTTASGPDSHAEGSSTAASGDYAHAEGSSTTASGHWSHAEGDNTTASGWYSHAEGVTTTAAGSFSHAEGAHTQASGGYSHAQNRYTIAQGASQTAIGKFNIANGTASSSADTDYAFIIGNGTSDTARSNALTVDWSGNVVASGDVTATGDIYISIDETAATGTVDGDLYKALSDAGLIT